jgi:transcriptional regulator EpsA
MLQNSHDTEVSTERELLLNIIERAAEVLNADEFMHMIENDLARLLPHEIFACGFGGVSPKGSYVHKVLQRNSPNEYYLELLQPDGRIDSPLMTRWRNTQQPVMFQSGRDDHEYPAEWVRIFNKYDLRNTVAHGMLDMQGALTSYFIFTRNEGEVGLKHLYLLKLLTPHLHMALVRILATLQDFGDYAGAIHSLISVRQRQIIHWLHEGKTNWEIARILGMTEKNVKYHIEQILVKLDVRNRTQAVACAVGLGLLSQTSTSIPAYLCSLTGKGSAQPEPRR